MRFRCGLVVARPGTAGQAIYRISEEQAFTTASENVRVAVQGHAHAFDSWPARHAGHGTRRTAGGFHWPSMMAFSGQ